MSSFPENAGVPDQDWTPGIIWWWRDTPRGNWGPFWHLLTPPPAPTSSHPGPLSRHPELRPGKVGERAGSCQISNDRPSTKNTQLPFSSIYYLEHFDFGRLLFRLTIEKGVLKLHFPYYYYLTPDSSNLAFSRLTPFNLSHPRPIDTRTIVILTDINKDNNERW